jgi:hypothetical protein
VELTAKRLGVTVNAPRATHLVSVSADGELADLNSPVGALEVPQNNLLVIDSASSPAAAGRVVARTSSGEVRTLVALYSVGKGRIVVVSDADLFLNRSIAKNDNAVLAAHLFARFGRPIVFDEFYHGLTVRGNPVWLLMHYPYGLIAALVVLVSAMWAWRGAVSLGPPLRETLARRRTLREYVDAMANMFHRGNCRTFLLREVRDGTLWALRKKLHLGPRQENVEDVARALRRKSPEKADRLLDAITSLNNLLVDAAQPKAEPAVEAARKVTECL